MWVRSTQVRGWWAKGPVQAQPTMWVQTLDYTQLPVYFSLATKTKQKFKMLPKLTSPFKHVTVLANLKNSGEGVQRWSVLVTSLMSAVCICVNPTPLPDTNSHLWTSAPFTGLSSIPPAGCTCQINLSKQIWSLAQLHLLKTHYVLFAHSVIRVCGVLIH